jgi:hypothetical protein
VSPTQRSLKLLREAGYAAEITEHWNPFARIRKDLFGIVDILCIKADETLAVQTTSYSNVSSRVTKILNSDHFPAMADAGWTVRVHGWKKPTKKVRQWTLRSVDLCAHGVMLPVKGDKP